MLELNSNPAVSTKFQAYPEHVRPVMEQLRALVLETATETESVTALEETLKWGEPSYLAKKGSTLRMNWKESSPEQYALYFSCSTQLVPTFRTVYRDLFAYEGNRALVFPLEGKLPIEEVKQCIRAALTYHRIKKLPLLGL